MERQEYCLSIDSELWGYIAMYHTHMRRAAAFQIGFLAEPPTSQAEALISEHDIRVDGTYFHIITWRCQPGYTYVSDSALGLLIHLPSVV